MRQNFENFLKKEELEKGAAYECYARNFTVGVWNGEGFYYIRHKFGREFLDVEYHWDDGPPFGTVKPIKRVGS